MLKRIVESSHDKTREAFPRMLPASGPKVFGNCDVHAMFDLYIDCVVIQSFPSQPRPSLNSEEKNNTPIS